MAYLGIIDWGIGGITMVAAGFSRRGGVKLRHLITSLF
jgi:hypothetical protein